MEKEKKKKHFLAKPHFPGGDKALTQFLYSQLRYPAAALEAGVEGVVVVEYDIDYKGNVVATRVLQPLGHGCDEEACRVVRLLKFEVEKNRGVRVVFHQKARLQFKKPAVQQTATQAQLQMQYVLTPATPAPVEEKQTTYTYTVQL